ncbi:endonuclease/exonuclease/phosphatase family protein [Ulvibacter litoralis]|uniref:Metal-dependent hydrolase, endonuclease/exonuclease/phosphatase family n=1 Tax=Ulvibacter litoralis TaxID=227084 RepID=A0A1G7ESG1_9FLAO|nr:endonuclease/exonuclease/phosphatase family protein [Ulvibacter litoralis]GHC54061.1 endonuclease [Ulvibacter litoralis]SDE66577.1 Metal-dependent hydrolase, endonuclease/exonuclease/phosphatase family [Ulvibacter litoralis]
MKKIGLFGNTIYLLNSIAAFLLVLFFVLPYIPPKSFPTLSLLTLTISPLLVVNALFAVYWLLRRKRKALLSIIVLVLSFFMFHSFFEFSSESHPNNSEKTLNVLSYNVRLFNNYQKFPTKNVPNIISELIEDEKPDVLFIQEFYRDSTIHFSGYPYQYIHFRKNKNKKGELKENALGHAILSKYPLVNTGAFDFKNTYNNTIYADVVKGTDTIRLYNLHLRSMGVLPSVAYLQEGDKAKLRKRMATSFMEQQDQVEKILAHKAKTKHPVLLCGDFNNTAFSYIYNQISEDMKDAFVEKGTGIGTTYLFDFYPMRIDFIFTSENFEVLKYKSIKETFSDHFPVSATVGWNSSSEASEE